MKKLINLEFFPINVDIALLMLRLWMGFGLFAKHGIEKIINFSQMQQHFPDPLHAGVTTSLILALISDAICSLMVMAGLGTRLAAGFIVLNLFVVFSMMHKFSFAEGHAEMVYIYLGGFLTIFLSGGGKYCADKFFQRNTN